MSVEDSVLTSPVRVVWSLAAVLLLAAGSPPLRAQDDTPPVGTESFLIPNLGGWSIMSSGTEETVRVGYGRISSDAGHPVVATDPPGLSVEETFDVIVRTRPPRVTRRISDVLVSAGLETYVWGAAFVFAAFFLLTGGNARAQGTVSADRAALVALYNATGGASWKKLVKEESLSERHGVTTTQRHPLRDIGTIHRGRCGDG